MRLVRKASFYLAVKEAHNAGDEERVRALLEEYDVDVEELEDVTVKQLFTSPG